MKKAFIRLAVLLLMSLFVNVPCSSNAAVKYTTYTNARFGYSIKHPIFFKQSKPLPQNGDGITMSGKRGKNGKKATLLMWGQLPVLYEDGKGMKKSYKSWGTRMSAVKANKKEFYYEQKSKNGKKVTFHYSYFAKGRSSYDSANGKVIVSMELTCRIGEKSHYKKIVKVMMKSMKENG